MNILLQGRQLIKEVFQPKKGEKVLVVTDKQYFNLADIVAKVFKDLELEVILWTMPSSLRPFSKLNNTLIQLLKESDISIYLLPRKIEEKIFRTKLAKEARKYGRLCMLTGIEKEHVNKLLIDYKELSRNNFALKRKLKKEKIISVKCPNGTKVKFSIEKRKIFLDHGIISEKGNFGTLPAGQLIISPIEDSFNGVIATKQIEEFTFKEPALLKFKKGLLIDYNYKEKKAKKLFNLIERLYKQGDKVKRIAKFAIGTNKTCEKTHNLIEATRSSGSINFALGDSLGLGKFRSRVHLDILLPDATVKAGKKTIIKEGKILN